MTRRAFTLIEVSAAIAITGIVALISYGSLRTALDTGDRSAQLRERVESAALLEQFLSAAGRHSVEVAVDGHPSFELVHALSPSGQPADHLSFLSRGVLAPLGATGLWAVDLDVTAGGVRLVAVPADRATSGRVTASFKEMTGLRVRALSSLTGSHWVETWTSRQPLPAAVMIELLAADGSPSFSPMIIRLQP